MQIDVFHRRPAVVEAHQVPGDALQADACLVRGQNVPPQTPCRRYVWGCSFWLYRRVFCGCIMLNPAYDGYRSHDMYCAICMEECFVGVTFLTACGHHFHRACLKKCERAGMWSCPICRSPDTKGVTCTPSLSEDVYYKLLGRRYLNWWHTIPSYPIIDL